MSRSTIIKVATGAIIVAAIILGFVLPITLTSSPTEEEPFTFLGVRLGLTAEARQALQQAGTAFPKNEAGFSIYHQVIAGLNKAAVDDVLFNDPGPTERRSDVCALVEMGENYTIGNCPIINIDTLTTAVHVYYDTQGWVVAYLLKNEEPSRAFQARFLNVEDPVLNDISRTTLLDALNEVLFTAGSGPRTPGNVGYFHWAFPNATGFLLFGTARGTDGLDRVFFVVPVNVTPLGATISQYISREDGYNCSRTFLDGNNVTGNQCNRQFTHHSVDVPSIGAVHILSHEKFAGHGCCPHRGASGAALMLIYSSP